MIRIASAQLWVQDQDEALEFWTRKVGMEVTSDVTVPEMGNFRWLAVSPVGQPETSIVLMAIPGAPVMDPSFRIFIRSIFFAILLNVGLTADRGTRAARFCRTERFTRRRMNI